MIKRLFTISLTLSILIVFYLSKFKSIELSQTDHFVIGEATARGISIGKRISQYYALILIGIASFLAFYWIFSRFKTRIRENKLIHLLDGMLPFSCLLLFISCFQPAFIESAQVSLFFTLLIFVFGFLENLNPSLKNGSTWMVIGLIFTTNYLLFHSAVIGVILAIVMAVLIQFLSFENKKTQWISGILISVPLIVFLGVESTLILNQRGIFVGSYAYLLIFWALALGFWLYRVVNYRKFSTEKYIFGHLAFIALIGIGIVQAYSPLLVQLTETFENANMLNPVMQYHFFGEIPIVDNLSSHLVSDFFWEFCYYVLNGYQPDVSMMIYWEFNYILSLLCIYYFLRTVFGNKPAIIIGLLLLPATYYVLTLYFAFALLPAALLYRYIQSGKPRHFYIFLASVIFIVVWRLDLGISLVSALLLLLPFWFYQRKTDRKILIKSLLLTALIGGSIALAFVVCCRDQFVQMKGYFGANQAHGLYYLTFDENNIFFLHYVILPIIVVAILIHTAFQYRKSDNRALEFILILFCLFYLFNLQRGLVRHSFAEQSDTFISSFAWLIIMLKGWSVIRKNPDTAWSLSAGTLVLSLFPLFLSINNKNGTQNIFQRTVHLSLKDLPKLEEEKINRVLPNPEFSNRNDQIIYFLKTHLKQDETFIDLSNTPMLYFYSEKNVPSYFNQYLQNTVTDELLEINLEELKRMKLPFVVFSQVPEVFFDNIDNIPNKVRHYQLTHFIYANYEPFAQIGSYRVWKHVNHSCDSTNLLPYPNHPENWNLGLIPYFWKASKNSHFNRSANQYKLTIHENTIHWKAPLSGNTFLELIIQSPKEQAVYFSNPSFNLEIKALTGKHRYRLPLGCSEQLNWYKTDSLNIHTSEKQIQLKNVHFVRLNPL